MNENTATTAQATTDYRKCNCSDTCPATTRNLFSQGHDARMVSRLVKQVTDPNADYNISDARLELHQRGGTHALQAKLDAAVVKAHDVWMARQDREKARAAKKAAKAGAAAAPVVPEPEPTPELVTAKVGRWTYEGTLSSDGERFRYTNRDGDTRTTLKFTLV